MSDFNPSQVLIRNSWEAAEGIIAATPTWHDHDIIQESLSSVFEELTRKSIQAGAQEPEPGPSKIVTSGSFNTELSGEAHAHYLANAQKNSSTSTLDTGVYQHKLAPSETGDTYGTMALEASRDDGMPQLLSGARVAKVGLSLGVRQYLEGQIDMLWQRHDYFKAATTTAGVGTKPLIRGMLKYADWILSTAAAKRVYFKVTDASGAGAGSVIGKFKVGQAASYGSTTVTVPVATWTVAIDSTSALPVGTLDMQIEAYFADFTGAADNDEYYFDAERAVWVPSYPDFQPFNEIYAMLLIDGQDYKIESVNLTIERPVFAAYAIGGRFPWVIRERGRRKVTGTIQRDYLDLNILRRLERAKTFGLSLRAYNGVYLASSAIQGSLRAEAATCRLSGPRPTVTSERDFKENLTFSCHPTPGEGSGNVDDVTIYLVNTIADLTV